MSRDCQQNSPPPPHHQMNYQNVVVDLIGDHEFDFLLLSLVVIVGGQFRRVMTARGFAVAIRARRRRGVYGFLLFERGPAFLLLRDEQYF